METCFQWRAVMCVCVCVCMLTDGKEYFQWRAVIYIYIHADRRFQWCAVI